MTIIKGGSHICIAKLSIYTDFQVHYPADTRKEEKVCLVSAHKLRKSQQCVDNTVNRNLVNSLGCGISHKLVYMVNLFA